MLMFYGAGMPAFLDSFPPVAHLGYLPDVARVELALCRSYHAADTAAIDPQILQSIAPDALLTTRLHLAPSVHLIRSNWPAAALYHANTNSDAPKPEMQAEDVLITRPEYDPEVTALPPGGGAFIATLIKGATLGEADKAATIATGDFDLTEILGLLLSKAAIIKTTEGTPK